MITAALTCLALNVYHEARGEDPLGQLAVAQVTMNRVASERYPDDVCTVVYQRNQFSWTTQRGDHKPEDLEAWDVAKKAAALAFADAARVPGITPKTLHYHADWTRPFWADDRKIVAHIDNHIFYEGIR